MIQYVGLVLFAFLLGARVLKAGNFQIYIAAPSYQLYVGGVAVFTGTQNNLDMQVGYSVPASTGQYIAIMIAGSGQVGFAGTFGGVPTKASDWHCEISGNGYFTSPTGWSLNTSPYDMAPIGPWPTATSFGTIATPPSWASAASRYPDMPGTTQWIGASGNLDSSHNMYCRYKINVIVVPTNAPTPIPTIPPTPEPSKLPTPVPIGPPTLPPTPQPSFQPTALPTVPPTTTAQFYTPAPTPTALLPTMEPSNPPPTAPINIVVLAASSNLYGIDSTKVANSNNFITFFQNSIQSVTNSSGIPGAVVVVQAITAIGASAVTTEFQRFLTDVGATVAYQMSFVLTKTSFQNVKQLKQAVNAALSDASGAQGKVAVYLKATDPADCASLTTVTLARNVTLVSSSVPEPPTNPPVDSSSVVYANIRFSKEFSLLVAGWLCMTVLLCICVAYYYYKRHQTKIAMASWERQKREVQQEFAMSNVTRNQIHSVSRGGGHGKWVVHEEVGGNEQQRKPSMVVGYGVCDGGSDKGSRRTSNFDGPEIHLPHSIVIQETSAPPPPPPPPTSRSTVNAVYDEQSERNSEFQQTRL